jgi:alpha/beta superfamily hydrolase
MAPDNKILGVISKEDKMAEIQRRLQEQETQKARQLLAAATSHFEALKITKNLIEEQLEKYSSGSKSDSSRK